MKLLRVYELLPIEKRVDVGEPSVRTGDQVENRVAIRLQGLGCAVAR